jgi:hypothetical protein
MSGSSQINRGPAEREDSGSVGGIVTFSEYTVLNYEEVFNVFLFGRSGRAEAPSYYCFPVNDSRRSAA